MSKLKCSLYSLWELFRIHLWSNYRIPISMHISLTNRCSNQCIYCNIHRRYPKDIWKTELLKSIMSEMKLCGTQRIHFTGGEPMLRDDLHELIGHAKKLGFFVSLITNGHQVAKRITELKDIDIVYLSYDGPPEVHSRLRGKHNVSEVLSALDALKSFAIPVWTVTVLNRYNAESIQEIVDFAQKNNTVATFTMLDFLSDSQDGFHPNRKDLEELILCNEERKRYIQKLIQLKMSGAPVGSSLDFLKNVLEWPYDNRVMDSKPSEKYQCWAGRAYASLDADGTLYACNNHFENTRGVSILGKGFKKAWEELPLSSDCQSCIHANGVEMNLACSLNSSSIINWLYQVIKISSFFKKHSYSVKTR